MLGTVLHGQWVFDVGLLSKPIFNLKGPLTMALITLDGPLSPVKPMCEQSLACWSTVNSCQLGISRGTGTPSL